MLTPIAFLAEKLITNLLLNSCFSLQIVVHLTFAMIHLTKIYQQQRVYSCLNLKIQAFQFFNPYLIAYTKVLIMFIQENALKKTLGYFPR